MISYDCQFIYVATLLLFFCVFHCGFRIAYGDFADKLAAAQPVRCRALRDAQTARHAAELACKELKDVAGNSTETALVCAVVEAENAVEKAQQAVKAALVDGYELLPVRIDEFAGALANTTQVWLVSGRRLMLPAPVANLLARAHNEEGLGLHIMGDNDPYIADANALLAEIYRDVGRTVDMSGNHLGAGYVMGAAGDDFVTTSSASTGAASDVSTGAVSTGVRGGFRRSCILTVGVDRLHSGVTVASVSFGDGTGLTPVIRTTNTYMGPLVTTLAFRPASGQRGALVVNTAFTTLFRKFWEAAGASRLYANIVAYLSMQPDIVQADSVPAEGNAGSLASASDVVVSWAAVKGVYKDAATGLCTAGGFAGPCAVSQLVCIPGHSVSDPVTDHVESVCGLYGISIEDATDSSVMFLPCYALAPKAIEAVKTDWAFNNPVAAGAENGGAAVSPFVFSQAYLALVASRGFANLEDNTCPFTRRVWTSYLPLVALGPDDSATTCKSAVSGVSVAVSGVSVAGDKSTGDESKAFKAEVLEAGCAHNYRRVKDFADGVFFGGPQSGSTSMLMLAGALWEMLSRLQADRVRASEEKAEAGAKAQVEAGAKARVEARVEDEGDEQTLVTIRAITYMLRQLVAHVGCAPNMTAVGTGVRVPLFDAFMQYCAADQTSFCLTQVAVLVHLVVRFGPRAPKDDERLNMLRTLRRAFIVQQLSAVCEAAKKSGWSNYKFFVEAARGLVGFAPGDLVDVAKPVPELPRWGFCSSASSSASSDGQHGGQHGGASGGPRGSASGDGQHGGTSGGQHGSAPHGNESGDVPSAAVVDWALLQRDLGGVAPVSDIVTQIVGARVLADAFARWWCNKKFPGSQHPFICKTSEVIRRWCEENSKFARLWNCEDLAGKAPLTTADARAAIDAGVVAHLKPITIQTAKSHFASLYGPSALACAQCGHPFATHEEAQKLLDEVDAGRLDAMHLLRAAVVNHLHAGHGEMVSKTGACTPATSGCSLYRAVQIEMLQPQNRGAQNGVEDRVQRIADAVQLALVCGRQGTESLSPSFTRATVVDAIRGYIRLRDAGAKEPTLQADGRLNIPFADKVREELSVLRAGIGIDTGTFMGTKGVSTDMDTGIKTDMDTGVSTDIGTDSASDIDGFDVMDVCAGGGGGDGAESGPK